MANIKEVVVEENEKVVEVVEEAAAEETVVEDQEIKESKLDTVKKIGKKILVPVLCVAAYALGVSSGKKKGGCGSDEPAAIPCNDVPMSDVDVTEF